MRYYGGHVSVAGGLQNCIESAKTLNINTIQIHPTAPQRWATSEIETAGIETLVKAQKNSPVKKIFSHCIYLINLAQPDSQKFHLSKMSIVNYINFMHNISTIAKHYISDIEAVGSVVHVGSAIHYSNYKEALARVLYGLNWVLEHSANGNLILESSAGAGSVIGSNLDDLTWLCENVEQKDRIFIGLDTQHMFASGYDWRETETTISKISSQIDLKKVKIIHFNDSQTPFDSKKDRHENLGQGQIGIEALKEVFTSKEFSEIPFVLETPNMKDVETAKTEVDILHNWAN